jgi:hypothetical protein
VDATSVTASVTAAAGATAAIATAGLQLRGRRQRARELRAQAKERRDLLRLPPGSRVIDFGKHGMVIEVGDRPEARQNDRYAAR